MKRYDDFEKLCEDNNINFKYADRELSNFLGCEGGDIVKDINIEPNCIFELENENNEKVQIGVTSVKIDKPIKIENTTYLNSRYFYWI